MKVPVPADKEPLFARFPRADRKPLSEVAAVQTFKLMGWATATAGIYLLQQHSASWGLRAIPYLLWLLVVWDLAAKFGWEPTIERTNGQTLVVLTRGYFVRLASIGALCAFVAWATIFWLAPLIFQHVLAPKLTGA